MKKYGASPLPFQGQKRRFVKEFKKVIAELDPSTRFLDLFGGSGLLSNTVKEVHPTAEVVYNDFDDFTARLNAIPTTNAILDEIRSVLQIHGCEPDKRLHDLAKADIIEVMEVYDCVTYVDYLSLSTALLFTQNYRDSLIGMKGTTMYNRVSKTNYDATGYLEGVTRVRKDWRELLKEYPVKDTILILDPPYLSTEVGSYTDVNYWGVSEYLDILRAAMDYRFIYFSSDKSSIFEITDWYAKHAGAVDIFGGARFTRLNPIKTNGNGLVKGYTDIMCDNLNVLI